MNIEKTFSDLPNWAKGFIAVTIVVGVGYGIYKISKFKTKTRDQEGAKDQVKTEISELSNSQKSKPATLTKSQAESIANACHVAMDGYGTDEAQVVAQLKKIKNNTDFLLVSTSYGVRKVSSGHLNPEPDFVGTLSGALHNELSQSWLDKINKDLKSKSIKYSF